MVNIRPISELRNTTEISEMCHKTKEPIFITKNGYGDLVIMSIETYERNQSMAEIYRKLGESEADLQLGVEPLDGEEVFDGLRAKHGY
ncbi:MAG: type II toxin-antitoxin system Phd/YefM family antitoxin [Defluviitaleaceae bacterium]|nr:type II toxin-antitoxin system Phd/YefM family antitoxin [Defluviitaleaceae bacterium]MCL2262327.1 type II toxin-antitoxin system Phd/YefM family antitoxin [Defluviitaleaceae bacterium]